VLNFYQFSPKARIFAILFGTLFAISGFVAAQPRFQAVTHEQAVIRHQQQLSQRRTNPHVGQDVDRLCS